ncbi:sensor histidine kinase [Hyphomicrobium sp.]|jgi:two-component system cell cycle sensor histidine kinase PleC|uniref:sensor histidine kinase n=1 Tax=Hyphomicrobium sp. TaxID=82 RepID=UPI003567DD2F
MDDNADIAETADTHVAMPPRRGRSRDDELKSFRERLTHGTVNKPEFEYELLTMFARNETSAPFAMPALCFIFYITSMFWASFTEATTWIAIVSISRVYMLDQCRRLLSIPRAEVNIGQWRRHFVRIELVNGFALAAFALIGMSIHGGQQLNSPATFSSHVFIFATLMVVLAIRMTFASTLPRLFLAGTVPMTVAVAARLFTLGDPFYFALASMAIGIHVFFVYLARGLHSTALAMVEFRAEKDNLISELEEATAISDEGRRRAEAANKSKSRFLATMSHELRTPLNAIMGFSEVMEKELLGPIGSDIYRDYALNIYQSGDHLLSIINEILDLSRIEAGRYDLNEETIRLTEITDDCQRLVKIKADAKALTIVEDFAPDLPQVWADPRALRQICLNLLSNALKFTPKGGRITLIVGHTQDGGQFLTVADNGPGIPKNEIPRVLQAFGQGSLAHESAEGGTGLGLSIVQNLIQLHGGTFDLQSELRKGTEVTVTLPPQRVLHAVLPLQPLGQERHRDPAAPRSPRQPRMRSASPYTTQTPFRLTGDVH